MRPYCDGKFGLVGLSIPLESMYPDFTKRILARIVSGFGGTLNFIIALAYVIFVVVSFAILFFSYETYHTIDTDTFHSALVIL